MEETMESRIAIGRQASTWFYLLFVEKAKSNRKKKDELLQTKSFCLSLVNQRVLSKHHCQLAEGSRKKPFFQLKGKLELFF